MDQPRRSARQTLKSWTTTKEDLMARTPIHPGEILADELAELGVTPTELSRQLAVPPNRISRIIQGKRAISGDTALRLGHWFRTSAQFWLNLRAAYDLDLAAAEVGAEVEKLPMRVTTTEKRARETALRRVSQAAPKSRQTGGETIARQRVPPTCRNG